MLAKRNPILGPHKTYTDKLPALFPIACGNMKPFGLGMLKLRASLFTGNKNEFGLGNFDLFPANKKLNPFGFSAFFFMPVQTWGLFQAMVPFLVHYSANLGE